MSEEIILLGHGSGGRLSHHLLEEIILPTLAATSLQEPNDAAVIDGIDSRRLAFTTDSYVVDPLIFPGGNIGDLAVNGTVNDLAMSGARALLLSIGLIIEEGLPIATLKTVLTAMRTAANTAGIRIVTGDTKVVPNGKADKLFINTSGIGVFDHPLHISGDRARPGDKILLSGTMADHGIAVLAGREGLDLQGAISSDSAALNGLVSALLATCGAAVHVLRDPTRGGVATTLNEIALQSGVDILLDESALPIKPGVAAACDILGLDPLYIANEGKLLAFVSPDDAKTALQTMHTHPLGGDAAIIGEVSEASSGQVFIETALGGARTVDMLAGEQLPRIC